jgi:hypothetical protein
VDDVSYLYMSMTYMNFLLKSLYDFLKINLFSEDQDTIYLKQKKLEYIKL